MSTQTEQRWIALCQTILHVECEQDETRVQPAGCRVTAGQRVTVHRQVGEAMGSIRRGVATRVQSTGEQCTPGFKDARLLLFLLSVPLSVSPPRARRAVPAHLATAMSTEEHSLGPHAEKPPATSMLSDSELVVPKAGYRHPVFQVRPPLVNTS